MNYWQISDIFFAEVIKPLKKQALENNIYLGAPSPRMSPKPVHFPEKGPKRAPIKAFTSKL